MEKEQNNQINPVNMQLILSGLKPKRKDIVVIPLGVLGKEKYLVKNKKGEEVLYWRQEEDKPYEDGRYTEYYHVVALTMGKIEIVVEYDAIRSETEKFMARTLPQALFNKVSAQERDKVLEKSRNNMSQQDLAMQEYLMQTLQR